jgi:hypothetical protein
VFCKPQFVRQYLINIGSICSFEYVRNADEPGIKYMPDPYGAAAELAAEKRWHVSFAKHPLPRICNVTCAAIIEFMFAFERPRFCFLSHFPGPSDPKFSLVPLFRPERTNCTIRRRVRCCQKSYSSFSDYS